MPHGGNISVKNISFQCIYLGQKLYMPCQNYSYDVLCPFMCKNWSNGKVLTLELNILLILASEEHNLQIERNLNHFRLKILHNIFHHANLHIGRNIVRQNIT